MRHAPLAVTLPETESRSAPHVELVSARRRPLDVVQAVDLSDVFAGDDADVTEFVADGSIEGREPVRQAAPNRVGPLVLQRLHEVEREYVRAAARQAALDVAIANGSCQIIEETPDMCFGTGRFPA